MGGLKDEIGEMFGDEKQACVRHDVDGEIRVRAAGKSFDKAVTYLSANGFNLVNLFCAEDFEGHRGFTLLYTFEKNGEKDLLFLERQVTGDKVTSLEDLYPSACWYEREIHDGFGLTFDKAFEDRHLFLHETYPDNFHPLRKSFKNGRINVKTHIKLGEEYKFKTVSGDEVYQIPVGPVHAGIIEPGHFRFSVIGETIFNLEVRMFYKHRGVEKLAEGRTPAECIQIAEAISGDETVANAAAYCAAVEKISKINVPKRALYLRTILLEMERIYSHLGDLAGMAVDVAYPAGASPFHILREEVLRKNSELTGSRFMREMISIGGLKKDVDERKLHILSGYLTEFSPRFGDAVESIHSTTSVIDRFEKTGIVREELVTHLNITGPTARASGVPVDTRVDHPYGAYGELKLRKRICETGDVLARFDVKAHEIHDSVAMIHHLIREMPAGEIASQKVVSDGYAMSLVESARGQSIHWVYLKNGKISRYKVRTASFCNWQCIEHAVIGNIVPDFPLINKSLNLSYAGTDL